MTNSPFTLSRRTLLQGVGATTALGLLTSCSAADNAGVGSGNGNSKKLNISYDGGAWGEFHDDLVTVPFSKKTGIEISTVTTTEDTTIAKLVANPNSYQFDCVKFGSNKLDRAVSLDLLQELDPEVVGDGSDTPEFFRSKYWIPNLVATIGIAYRSDMIPQGLTSWWDLWDKNLEGKVGMPEFSWIGNTWMMALQTLLKGDIADPQEAAKRLKEYMALKPVSVPNADTANKMMQSGEIWAMPFYDGRARSLKDAGVDVTFVYPDEGSLPVGQGMALSGKAKNPEGGAKYVAFDTAPEQQLAFARKTKYSPTSLTILKDPPADIKAFAMRPEDLDNAIRVDFLTTNQNISTYEQLWNEEVLTAG